MAVGGVPSFPSLNKLLDQSPLLSEVCEYARTSHWYKLGIQLELDEVELGEIRDDTGSDKRSRMYQLWLHTQSNATRRQLLTALRTKDVGENTVADNYEQMLFDKVLERTSSESIRQYEEQQKNNNTESTLTQNVDQQIMSRVNASGQGTNQQGQQNVVYNITRSTIVVTDPGSKGVGENTVAHDYEQMFDKLQTSQLTTSGFTDQPLEDTPNPVIDVKMIYEEIEEVHELAEVAYKLRDDSFPTLYLAVRRSLEAHNVNLHDAKDLVCLALSQNHFSSQEMEMYTAKLERVNDMKDLLAFLLNHHFISYINYALLRKISKLADDSNISNQFEQYEQKCTALFKKASINDIMEMFCQYPDLKPLTAIGLPCIVLRLRKHWRLKPFHTWNTTFAVKVPSSDSCLLHEIKENCVLITYAVLPSALPAVLKYLRDPTILKELEEIGVTVVQLPDNNYIVSTDDYKGEVSNEFIITLPTEPSTSLNEKLSDHESKRNDDLQREMHCDNQVSSCSENVMDARQNEVESETLISPEQEFTAWRLSGGPAYTVCGYIPHKLRIESEEQGAVSSQKEEFEERLQVADQNYKKKIKEFESLEKKLTNIETSTKQHHDDQDLINIRINDKITKLENEMQSSFSDLQCQVSQLITRIDETDKKLGQFNKQFETRNDEIMQTMLANGKKDIDELSEKLKASQVEVDELKQNLSDLQVQLNQSIEEMKKDMAELSKVHSANDAPPSGNKSQPAFNETSPSGNKPQPAFNETMNTLCRKLDHLADSLIPKEVSERRRSIIQSYRNETRQIYRPRPQSLFLESSLSEPMDSPVLQRSYSTSSAGSSGRGTLPHQQSGESLPAIDKINNTEQQNISLSLPESSTLLKELSPVGTNGSPQMRRQISTPAQSGSQQSNETSSGTHHNIVEVVWAMGDLVDHLKNLAENFVDSTSDTSQPAFNETSPSGNKPQPAFSETMNTLHRKLDHLTDSLIPKEVSERRRSIIQSHRNETRQIYRPRPQSLFLESSLSEPMDSPVLQRSYSTSSAGSSGRGTLPHQQSGESLPAIDKINNTEQQNISLSLPESSTLLKELSPVGTNGSPQMRRQISTPAQSGSQQSNETSSGTHHNIVEVVWAMGDLVDHLKNLAENFVDSTSDTSQPAFNETSPSGNKPQPAFSETMNTLHRKLDHLTDSLIPKDVSERRRSILQSHRNETRQSYRIRPQSLFLESSLLETMDSPVRRCSYSTASTGSSGRGTLSHQQSGESLSAISEQNRVSERRRPVIQSHKNDTRENNRPFPPSQLLESKTMDSLEHQSTSGHDSLSSQESLPEIHITEQQDISPSLPNSSTLLKRLSPVGTNESFQMKRQISTPPQLVSQQSNENSSETHHNVVEVLWAMGDLVDHLKNLAGNFVDNTSTSDSDPGLVLTSTDNDTNNGIGGTP